MVDKFERTMSRIAWIEKDGRNFDTVMVHRHFAVEAMQMEGYLTDGGSYERHAAEILEAMIS